VQAEAARAQVRLDDLHELQHHPLGHVIGVERER
jgi:hypothetical protein